MDEFSGAKANNLDFLRLVFAGLVIVMHSFYVFSSSSVPEPLHHFTLGRVYSGTLAVYGFFAISGYLIVASWLRVPRLGDFMKRRVLRIYPGFVACCLLCVFVVVPWHGPTFMASFGRCSGRCS